MDTILKYFWVVVVIALIFGYFQWVSNYNKALDKWQPIVAECSNHGGFMTASGTCDYNQ